MKKVKTQWIILVDDKNAFGPFKTKKECSAYIDEHNIRNDSNEYRIIELTPDHCKECKEIYSEIKPHTCPFKMEIYESDTLCSCCSCERQTCADDI